MKFMIGSRGEIHIQHGKKLIPQFCHNYSMQLICGEGKSGGYYGDQDTSYQDVECTQSCPKFKEPVKREDGSWELKLCGERYIFDEFVDNREKKLCHKCQQYKMSDEIVSWQGNFTCRDCFNKHR